MAPLRLVLAACLVLACSPSAETDEAPDDRDESFTGGKADGFCVDEHTPVADGLLALANDPDVDVDELDHSVESGGAGLWRVAAENIVAARPIADLAALDAVPYVGLATCQALAAYACNEQHRCLADFDLMTWNLEHFPLTSATEDAVVEILGELDPQLVGVQEIESEAAFDSLRDRLPAYDGILGRFGDTAVGLLYQPDAVDIVDVDHLFQSDGYAFPRPVLAVRMRLLDAVEPTEIVVLVVHLKALSGSSNEARRRSAVGKLRTWIDARRADGETRIAVVGDWNDRIDEPAQYNVFGALLDPAAGVEFLTEPASAAGEYSYVPFATLIDHVLVTDETLDVLVEPETHPLRLDETRPDYVDEVTDHRPVRTRFGLAVGD